ncbi:hypothetical protein [Nesterenkonia pannonica]|nr:hypothetical protein [Nesterenkonia pannonica]
MITPPAAISGETTTLAKLLSAGAVALLALTACGDNGEQEAEEAE